MSWNWRIVWAAYVAAVVIGIGLWAITGMNVRIASGIGCVVAGIWAWRKMA